MTGGVSRPHAFRSRTAGWTVRVLPGLDHMSAMRSAVVLPLLWEWLESVSPAR